MKKRSENINKQNILQKMVHSNRTRYRDGPSPSEFFQHRQPYP